MTAALYWLVAAVVWAARRPHMTNVRGGTSVHVLMSGAWPVTLPVWLMCVAAARIRGPANDFAHDEGPPPAGGPSHVRLSAVLPRSPAGAAGQH